MALVLRLLNWLIERLTEQYNKLDDASVPDSSLSEERDEPDSK